MTTASTIAQLGNFALEPAPREAVLILDSATKTIVAANALAPVLLGIDSRELVGAPFETCGLFRDSGVREAFFREIAREGSVGWSELPEKEPPDYSRRLEIAATTRRAGDDTVIDCLIREVAQQDDYLAASARLAAVVESSEDGIVCKTLDGIITSWNGGAERLFGYSAQEAVGRRISFLIPRDRADEMPRLLAKIRRGERVEHFETVRVAKDGTFRDISLSISPLKDAAGTIVGASSIKRDITASKRVEKELRDSEARYRSIFNNSFQGIYEAGPDGVFKLANSALKRILCGRTDSQDRANPEPPLRLRYVDPGRQSELVRLLELHSGAFGFESCVLRPDGTRTWISENLTAILNSEGRLLRYQGVVRDIPEPARAPRAFNFVGSLLLIGFAAIAIGSATDLLPYILGPVIGHFWSQALDEVVDAAVITTIGYIALRKQAALHERTLAEVKERKQSSLERERLQAQIEEQRQKLATTVENVPGVVWESQFEPAVGKARLTFISDYVETMLGYRVEECLPVSNFWHSVAYAEDKESVTREYTAVAGGSKPHGSLTFRVVAKDGRLVWLESRLEGHSDATGSIRGIRGVNVDVTERKEAEFALLAAHHELEERVADRTAELRRANEELGLRKTILELQEEATVDGILVVDENGDIASYNKRFADMWNLPPAVLAPRSDEAALDAVLGQLKDPDAFLAKVRYLYENQSDCCHDEIELKDDRTFERYSAPIQETGGNYHGRIWFFHDITEHRRLEVSSRLAQENAERANRAKSEFLSRMSHELRTPLNAILGFGQILECEELSGNQTEAVSYILKGGRHLLNLINEVLDISAVEAGRLDLSSEPIQLDDIIPEVCALLAPLAALRDVRLDQHLEGAIEIVGDPQRFQQVLINLVSNAIKYNHVGGQVIVSSRIYSGHRARVMVQDTGPGISPENLEKVFAPFERLSVKSDIEGTGLGLTLARRMVDAMGGSLHAESVLYEGSTFWIDLPISTLAPHESNPGNDSSTIVDPVVSPDHKHTVLCIEDSSANLKLFEKILGRRPAVTMLTAMQGSVGVDLANFQKPDLIVLDMRLPDMTGNEVMHRLRQPGPTESIPIVIVTANTSTGESQRLLAAGAQAYLTKPLNITQFLQTVDSILGTAPEPAELH